MFNRLAYKKSALATLKNSWALSCILTIIFLFISGMSFMASPVVNSAVTGIISVGIISVLMKIISDFPSTSTNYSDSGSEISFSTFLEVLENHWVNALLGGLWRFLWLFLWTLLFVIPGFVKWYSYSMMYFVMAENPKLSAMKALDISKVLTNGHKADLLMFDLSFLGWLILCCFTSGLGFIWLYPYYTMTKTHAYYDLKKMALAQNRLTPADFEV